MTRERKKLSKRSVIILIALCVIAFTVSFGFLRYHTHNTYFTVEKWHDAAWNDRQLLIKSFLKQYDLNQMTKSEIINLLGEDTAYYLDYAIPSKTNDNLVYDFGLQENQSASNMSLIISFDANDRVSSYELKSYSQ